MNFFEMLMNDSIVFISIIGLLLLLGIGGFYIYYFISHIKADEAHNQHDHPS